MKRKAVAYVSDIILGQTGEVIPCDEQLTRIRARAAADDVELVAVFRDELYEEDPTQRPGLARMCVCKMDVDVVLVDRVWAISRDWRVLRPFLKEMKECGVGLECASLLWDCVSQMTRNFFRSKPVRLPTCAAPEREKTVARAPVRRPAQLHFAGIRRAVLA